MKTYESAYYTVDDTPDEEYDDDEDNETQASLNACMATFSTVREPWFLDSGASSHVTGNGNLLSNLIDSSISSIWTAAGQVHLLHNKGTVSFSC